MFDNMTYRDRLMSSGVVFAILLTACHTVFCDPLAVLPIQLPLRPATEVSLPIAVAEGTIGAEENSEYLYPTQYRIWIPDNATSLVIEAEPVPGTGGDIDLYVRRNQPVTDDPDYVYCSEVSAGPSPFERIILVPMDSAYLDSGVLFISVGSPSLQPVSFVLRLLCKVDDLPGEEPSSDTYLVNVPFLFCQVDEQFTIMIPDGWVRVPSAELSTATVAAFEMPSFSGLATAACLEISRLELEDSWELDQLQAGLERTYETEDQYISIDRDNAIIDGQPSARSWLISELENSAVAFACFIDEGTAWLLTLTFTPLGYGATYDTIFDMATESFQRINLANPEHASSDL